MKTEEILQVSADLVSGDRAKTYGDKKKLHDEIARYWSTYLGVNITAENVAICMLLLKVARTKTGSSHMDNFIDMVGYSAIAGEIHDEKR